MIRSILLSSLCPGCCNTTPGSFSCTSFSVCVVFVCLHLMVYPKRHCETFNGDADWLILSRRMSSWLHWTIKTWTRTFLTLPALSGEYTPLPAVSYRLHVCTRFFFWWFIRFCNLSISTTENLAVYIWDHMVEALLPDLLYEIKIHETDKNIVVYRGE